MFHPDAAKRFNELGLALRDHVRVIKKTLKGRATTYEPYPAGRVTPGDLIGKVEWTDYVTDGLGRRVGLLWTLRGETVGLLDESYGEFERLAEGLAKTPSLRGRVDLPFLRDAISRWLQQSYEAGPIEPLAIYVERTCVEVIKEYEIWVPLFRVHALESFPMGDVLFQKITPEMMDRFFNRPEIVIPDVARARLERLRSDLQNHLAACVKVTAEKKTAQSIARAKAGAAIALVRFLSPTNWILNFQSHCVPLGYERIDKPVELFVQNAAIKEVAGGTIERGPWFWDIETEKSRFPELLDHLHALCLDHSSDFGRQLYDALLLYSRNSTAHEITDKLIFILVSLESILLKDGTEPITKNIGERLAFLIGDSVEERKAVIQNVDAVYRVRSKFVHHGESGGESQVVERFCEYAWQCFCILLGKRDRFKTRAALIEELENRKLS